MRQHVHEVEESTPGEERQAVWSEHNDYLLGELEAETTKSRTFVGSVNPSGPGRYLTEDTPFIVSEVSRSVAFYLRDRREEAAPRALVILGAPDVSRAFQELLHDTQPFPVVPARSASRPLFEAFAGADSATLEDLVAVFGAAAAAAGIDGGIPRLDLAQHEQFVRERSRRTAVAVTGVAACSLWLLLSAGAAVGLSTLEYSAQVELGQIRGEVERIQRERAPLLRQQQISAAARAAREKVHVPASSVLGRVAAAANPGIALRALQVNADGRVTLEGSAIATAHVQRFALELGRGRSLRLPVIENIKRDQAGQLTFRIAGKFREAQPAAAPGTDGKEPAQ